MSNWLRNLSISHRLILIITSINVVIIILIGMIAVSSNRRALESQTTRRFAEKNQQVASAISTELAAVLNSATQIQQKLSGLQDYSPDQLRTTVRDILTTDSDILIHRVSIYRPSVIIDAVASDDSVVVMQIPEPRTGVISQTRTFTFDNQLPAHEALMFDAIEQNAAVWFVQQTAYQDSQDRGAISLALPYAIAQDVQGVVWVDIPQPAFDVMVNQHMNPIGLLSDTVNGFAVLVDNNQHLVNSYGELSENLTVENVDLLLASVNAESTVDNLNPVINPLTDQEDLSAIDPLSANGWQLISILPRDDIPTPSAVLIFQLAIVAVAGISVTVLAVHYFTRRAIVEPLSNLSRVAEEIGTGDLRHHIAYRDYEDEIGFLARAMEVMKGNIAHSYNELRQWSRTVEARVYERTKELNATRREAEYQANELQAIYDESLIVVNEPTLEPILDAFTQRILVLLDASYCSIWLLDDTGETIRRVTNTQEDMSTIVSIPLSQGMVGQSIEQQEVVIVDEYTTYEHRVDIPNQDETPYSRAMVAPLLFDGKPMGAVVVGRSAESKPFTEVNTRRLTLFANLVSPAVRNAQLFNQREAARREAERANQVKTRFLASVTHELRTPLNLIINNMDFMRIGAFGDINDEQTSRLNQTVRSAEHLLYLINDLLDVSKIEAGEMQLFIQPNDMMTIIEDSIDSAYAYIEKMEGKAERVQFLTDVAEDLPKIPMDSRRIRQVITNLLSNAIKFTHDGEVKLIVKAVDEGVFVAVQDSGIGIPDAELGKLFEAFERTNQAKEDNIEGTGLGLPISQFLVQQHGATLDVESEQGVGTMFMFTLPYETPDVIDGQSASMTHVLSSEDR